MRTQPSRAMGGACPDDAEENQLPIISGRDDRRPALAAVLLRQGDAVFSNEALHGRSPMEQGVDWVDDPDQVPDGERVVVVWLRTQRNQDGQHYISGAVGNIMSIDREALKGYKNLGQQVNNMRAVLERGKVDLEMLTDDEQAALRGLLDSQEGVLAASPEELRDALNWPAAEDENKQRRDAGIGAG